MPLGKKKILAVFLEKDNLKLLAYEGKTRVFAGQITFSPEVLRDGFIADAEKFNNQTKVAFAQKETLHATTEVLLFISPDKAFTKTLAAADSVDAFVHGLPYFKEELIINTEGKDKITYVAFEKKLIEDLQRPFLDSGKKITGIKSAANVLARKFAQTGKYLLLIPLEKEVVAVVAENGDILDLAVIKNEVFNARLEEFKAAHNLAYEKIYSVGVFPAKFNIQTVNLAQTDIYDLIVSSSLTKTSKIKLPEININKKYLLLAGAILAGALLVVGIVKAVPQTQKKTVSPVVTTPPPQPPPQASEPKPADYPIAVFNGTLVAGEAGKLAEKLKATGFTITETKNATSAGFVATRLRVTKDVPDKITAELKTSLLETYEQVNIEPVATTSAKAAIEIIIGKKK